jgi:hypothetical protein
VELVVVDTGTSACQFSGYPRVDFVASAGGRASLMATAGGTALWADPGPRPVVLAPGGSAVAGIEWAAPSQPCQAMDPGWDQVRVALPGGTGLSTLSLPAEGCRAEGLAVTALTPDPPGLRAGR